MLIFLLRYININLNYDFSRSVKYNAVYNKGYNSALDTINKILDNQVKSDSTITKLKIIDSKKDTLTYIIKRK
ncbi:hypothetical protein [Tenacibaculum phage Larrie]|nr:hypothetical protein [Tenacibaculum phage Larrie]